MTPAKLIILGSTRPNLIAFPEALDNAAWAKAQSTVSANVAVAPNGTTTADKLIATAVLNQHRIDYTPVSQAGTQTFSVHLKPAEYGYAMLRINTNGTFYLSLADGTWSGSDSSATVVSRPIGNGWYRWAITTIAAAGDTVRINVLQAANFTDYTGDGTSGIYVWGAKLEQAPNMSRYKPV